MNTAEYLIKCLEELGVNDFFGLPGDYNFNLLYAVENNPNTRWIGCTNELNAGYAADGYARLRGYGAIITTYGVGELSAINAIAGSMAENVPVVSIVGVPATKCINNKTCVHHNFQDVNYYACYEAHKPVTAAAAYLTRDNAKIEIDRVLKVLVKEKKPVYIAIPLDIAKMEISDKKVSYDWTSDEETLKLVSSKIAAKINNSKKPVILGDVLVKRFDSRIEYKEFVSKSGIPVTNFLMGTNLIDMDYEKYLGGYYAKFENPAAQKAVEETDCLIAVGAVYTDLNAFGFNLPYKINDHIAIYGTYTYVEGERYNNVKMSDVLEAVTKLIDKKDIYIEKPQIGYEHQAGGAETLSSKYIYPRLQEFLKENDILIAETGIVPHGVAPMKFPHNVELQTQTLWGSIGWGTPAALGVCLAKPKSRVILITGEGSHQLTAMEIGNMLRRGIKPIIIVLNNNGYTIERVLSDKPEDKFNDIMQMNYSKFARVFEGDVWATKVTTAEDFDKALKVTQIMNKMCYIEICTEKMDMPKLTENLTTNFRKNNKLTEKSTPEQYCEPTPPIEPENKSLDFETVVHKRIGEI